MSTQIHISEPSGYHASVELNDAVQAVHRRDCIVWIDTTDRSDEIELFLGKSLGIHPLAIEDVYEDYVTPKVDDYGEYLHLVMHGVRRDAEDPESLGTIEIDIIVGNNWVFTQHTAAMRSVDGLSEELARNPRLLSRGPAYVAHALLDRLTEHYLPVVDRFDEEIDELEKLVVAAPNASQLSRLFALKRSLQRLRRISIYQRDILFRLSRGEFEQIPEKTLPFFRDLYDHFVRIVDLADSYRELVTSALEIYMSVTANRTNDIMKVLALISTLMLPLTFIAGVYGMNFEYMPELKWRFGYPFAISLMVVVVIVFLWFFRKRKWI